MPRLHALGRLVVDVLPVVRQGARRANVPFVRLGTHARSPDTAEMATDTLSRIKGFLKGLVLVADPRPRRASVPPAEARRGLLDCE